MIENFTSSLTLSTAALSLPDDALYHIFKQVKPSVQVFFSQQDVPEEDVDFPYLLIEKQVSRTTGIEYGEIEASFTRDKYVSKECEFILTYVGSNAVENLSDYVEARDSFSDIMNKMNAGITLQENVTNISAIINTTSEERAQVEGTIRYIETIQESINNIGSMVIEAEVFDIDGTKVYDEEIEITE